MPYRAIGWKLCSGPNSLILSSVPTPPLVQGCELVSNRVKKSVIEIREIDSESELGVRKTPHLESKKTRDKYSESDTVVGITKLGQ